MKSNEQRLSLLNKILNLQPDYVAAMQELSGYKWDFDGKPLTVSRSVFVNILSLYIEGKITASVVLEWADFLEVREDFDYTESDEDILSEILHELANPLLEGELTIERAKEIISKL